MEDLVYQILIEASNKRVYVDRPYNIAFNTIINTTNLNQDSRVLLLNKIKNILINLGINIDLKISNENISLFTTDNNNLFVPTLIINDILTFINKLKEYLRLAKEFYDKDYYDAIEYEDKTILTLLWSNATLNDFNNPIAFIEKRIDFLIDSTFNEYSDEKIVGNSSILKSQISINIEKEAIYQETPYSFNVKLLNNENLDESYILPKLRFGISNNKCTIMAIQNNKKTLLDNTKYSKKIKRLLNKVNQNFELEEYNDNIDNPENLTGIVPSFLVVSTIFLSLIKKLGMDDVEIVPFLPIRWNAKELMYLKIKEIDKNKQIDIDKINEKYKNNTLMHYDIQRNLSDKLIRNFRRLAYHFNNINILSYPYEVDEMMHFKLNDEYSCNNDFLNELYTIFLKNKKMK